MPSASVALALAMVPATFVIPPGSNAMSVAHCSMAAVIAAPSAMQSLQQLWKSATRRLTSRDRSGLARSTFWLMTTAS
jgi:hypothetical protein